MAYLALKYAVTAAIIVAIAETARRVTWLGAALAALPLTSLLAFVWLYLDGVPSHEIAQLSVEIVWLVLASLPLFIVFAWLLRSGYAFWSALGIAVGGTAVIYLFSVAIVRYFSHPL